MKKKFLQLTKITVLLGLILSPLFSAIPHVAAYEDTDEDYVEVITPLELSDEQSDDSYPTEAEDAAELAEYATYIRLIDFFEDRNLAIAVARSLSILHPTTITDYIPAEHLLLVEVLIINNTDIDGQPIELQSLEGIQYLTRIGELEINGTRSNDLDLSLLIELPNLNHLGIIYMPQLDTNSIAQLENLRSLALTASAVSDTTFLAGLTNLRFLFLDANQITDLRPLATIIPNLTSFSALDQRLVLENIEHAESSQVDLFSTDGTRIQLVGGSFDFEDGVLTWHNVGLNEAHWNDGVNNFSSALVQYVIGEAQTEPTQPIDGTNPPKGLPETGFDTSLNVMFIGSALTSLGGLVAYKKLKNNS